MTLIPRASAELWRRLVSREPEAAGAIVIATIFLTWFVVYPMVLGQTSPFLFLAASLSLSRAGVLNGPRCEP